MQSKRIGRAGEKKVSIYIELDGLDEIPDQYLDVALVNARRVVFFAFTRTGQRLLSLSGLFGECVAAKLVRKYGKNRVVLKLTKKESGKWPRLHDGMQSGMSGGLDETQLGKPSSTGNMGVDVSDETLAREEQEQEQQQQHRRRAEDVAHDNADPFANIPEPAEDCVD